MVSLLNLLRLDAVVLLSQNWLPGEVDVEFSISNDDLVIMIAPLASL